MVVALARLAGGFIKPVVSITALVTLQARDTNFTLAFPRAAQRKTVKSGCAGRHPKYKAAVSVLDSLSRAGNSAETPARSRALNPWATISKKWWGVQERLSVCKTSCPDSNFQLGTRNHHSFWKALAQSHPHASAPSRCSDSPSPVPPSSSTCAGPGSCRTLGHPRSLRLNDKRAPMCIITSPPHRRRSVPPRFLGKRTIPCSPPAFPAPPRAGSTAQVSHSGFSPGRHQPPALPPLLLHDPIYPFHATTPRPPRQSSSLQLTSPTQEDPGKDKWGFSLPQRFPLQLTPDKSLFTWAPSLTVLRVELCTVKIEDIGVSWHQQIPEGYKKQRLPSFLWLSTPVFPCRGFKLIAFISDFIY